MIDRILLQNSTMTPLGRLRLAGEIQNGRGVRPAGLRVYGAYAVMCVEKGRGAYRDAHGTKIPLTTGDVVLVFPEHAHHYGPGKNQTWDEMYATFDGPVFDLWRQAGLLHPSRPVRRVPRPQWTGDLRGLLARSAPPGHEMLRQVCDFLSLLNELLLSEPDVSDAVYTPIPPWEVRARILLEIDLGMPLDLASVAQECGMGYETFRKRFVQNVGVSPAQYRQNKRIEAARELLRYSPHTTNRQAALALGFADEYHFSKCFSRRVGLSPRTFRQQISGANKETKRDKTMAITVKRLEAEQEIAQMRTLRGSVLRPGLPPEASHWPFDGDPQTVHIGAINENGQVVGIATVCENNGLQLRGMAVAPDVQTSGVGRQVLAEVQQVARERNAPLWCNARTSAVGFYQKMGWVIEGDEFHVEGVGPHYIMRWAGDGPQP